MGRALGAALLAAGAAGCAPAIWTHPGRDPEAVAVDLQECGQAAYLEANQQIMFRRLSRPRIGPGGTIMPGGESPWDRQDAWFLERRLTDMCMRARGYSLSSR